MIKHPYSKHESTALWKAIDKAIGALVVNGDIVERTARQHIVGYLCQTLGPKITVRDKNTGRSRRG
jgi:hypothetical protein